MKASSALLAALVGSAVAVPNPQGVTEALTPAGAAPAGCTGSASGTFEVAIVELAKRDVTLLEPRAACGGDSILVVTLENGVLKDAQARTGYIASNFQFQFDGPPQAGSLFTAGFSVCGNGSLALGASTVFYQCLSGSFYNLYDRHWAAQCEPVHINAIPCGGTGPIAQIPDGQVVGTTVVATTMVTVLPDGQPQVVPTSIPIPLCQIGDGQIQGHTTPCASLPVPTVTPKPVSQIPDGQIQVPPPTAKPVSQISDGQIQAPTGKPVSQISDGQIQAPTGKPVSQISDGQIQAPATTPAPAPPAPTTPVPVVPTPTTSVPAVVSSPVVGSAGRVGGSSFAAAVLGLAGAVFVL
jgi:hypothetical protein